MSFRSRCSLLALAAGLVAAPLAAQDVDSIPYTFRWPRSAAAYDSFKVTVGDSTRVLQTAVVRDTVWRALVPYPPIFTKPWPYWFCVGGWRRNAYSYDESCTGWRYYVP